MFAMSVCSISHNTIGGRLSLLEFQRGSFRTALVTLSWLRGHGVEDFDFCGIREAYHHVACLHGRHVTRSLPDGESICIHCGETSYPLPEAHEALA